MTRILAIGLMLLSSHCFASTVQPNDVLRTLKAIQAKLNQPHSKGIALQPATVEPSQPATHRIATGEFLLFSLSLNDMYLGEVFAIKSEQGVLLGLSGLVEILQLAINVDTASGSAAGWFIEQSNLFSLSATKPARLLVNNQAVVLSSQQLLISDDIYIDAAVLESAFMVKVSPDYANLALEVTSDELFPVVAQQQRRNQQFSYQQHGNNQPTQPWKASPYQVISAPVADLQLNYRRDNDSSRTSYSLLGAQDFAYLSAEYFLAGREQDLLTDSRLTFSKQALDSSLLGAFAASEIRFGDITATQVGSRYNSQYGRGVKFSNYQLDRNIDNNRINLTGAIQPGWDVELYRNGLLIEQQLSLADGRYLFDNIDLLYGENNFELIFYGPQGQVERKTEYYFIDGNQLGQGEATYEVSVSEQGKQLLGNESNSQQSGWLAAGRYERGLTDNIAIYTGAMAQKREDDDFYQFAFGSNINLFERLLLNLDYEQNNQQQNEFELTARTQLAEQSLLFTVSDRSDQQQDFQSYQFDMTGELMENNYGRLHYQNNFLLQQSSLGRDLQQAYNRFNYSYSGFSVNNLLQWQKVNEHSQVYGATRIQGRIGRVYSRFGVDYLISPQSDILSYQAEFSRSITAKLQAELTLRNTLNQNIQSADLGLNWQNDNFNLSSTVNYDSNDNWLVSLYSRFSFGFDAQNNRTFMTNRSLTSTGSLMVRVFLDQNNNGTMDEGEQGVAGVKVKGLQNYRQAITDEQGIALLTSMPANRTTDIVLDKDSFPDPFLVPAHEGFSITPRAGFIEYMDYPINNSSEVEGVVYLHKGETNEVKPYAKIALLDIQGNKVAQTQAAYDGYYLFTDLRPGEYQAVIEDNYKDNKGLKETQNITVNLSPQGDVVMGVDFVLTEKVKASGYIANAGSFSSLAFLKAYFQLIKQHLKPESLNEAFYLQENERYVLAIGYAVDASAKLESTCNNLKNKGLNCTVKAQQITH
ncbi:MSCRAMM family protein [Pseudoalteromonas sp. SaAl2]